MLPQQHERSPAWYCGTTLVHDPACNCTVDLWASDQEVNEPVLEQGKLLLVLALLFETLAHKRKAAFIQVSRTSPCLTLGPRAFREVRQLRGMYFAGFAVFVLRRVNVFHLLACRKLATMSFVRI